MPNQRQKDLTSQLAQNGGQLNPEFVEWMQNYPIGWTDLNVKNEDLYRLPLKYEPDIPKVTTKSNNRANRLKGLGNAIFTEMAYELGMAILAAEQTRENENGFI